MKRRVVLRPAVPDDLHGIVAYLDHHSESAGDRFIASVFATFDDLSDMPGKGSPKDFPRSGLAGVRSWAVPGFPNHLVYYQTHAEAIIVLAVLHGARDVPRILEERSPRT